MRAALSSARLLHLRRKGIIIHELVVKCIAREASTTRLFCPRLSIIRHYRVGNISTFSRTANASTLSMSRSFSSRTTQPKNSGDWLVWVPSLVGRLIAAFGLIHVTSEYGLELTLCEGPSMLPTILPRGEIILVDRLTPRLFGLQGGDRGAKRAEDARKVQEEYIKRQRQEEQKSKSLRKAATEYHEKWHQVMIPVNELPTSGKWKRMFVNCTTGIHVGDVVVVQHPDRSGTVCKRVLGLPGDVVVQPAATYSFPNSSRGGLLVVPDGHLWIEGDNSMNSSDSRNYGPIPASLLVGRVLLRLWPIRGNAMMERGARPVPPPNSPFSGSTVLPAGYEGEVIVRQAEEIP